MHVLAAVGHLHELQHGITIQVVGCFRATVWGVCCHRRGRCVFVCVAPIWPTARQVSRSCASSLTALSRLCA